MTVTTVNPKGQVTIPEPLRRRYGLLPGRKVVWIEHDDVLIARPLLSARELRGRFRSRPGEPTLTKELLAERRADREREDAR